MNESAREWQEPKESKKYRDGCNDFRVDEAGHRPVAITTKAVEICASKASYDGRKGKLKGD